MTGPIFYDNHVGGIACAHCGAQDVMHGVESKKGFPHFYGCPAMTVSPFFYQSLRLPKRDRFSQELRDMLMPAMAMYGAGGQ